MITKSVIQGHIKNLTQIVDAVDLRIHNNKVRAREMFEKSNDQMLEL